MDGRLGVAMIGMGKIGRVHLADLLDSRRVVVLWILDKDVEAARKEVDKHHMADHQTRVGQVDDDLQQMYDDDRVNAVVISSPTATHVSFVQGSLNAGKAVFCEKPLATTSVETQECCQLAEQRGLALFCGLSRRFDPQFRYLYDAIRNGVVGDIRTVSSISRDPPVNHSADYITSGLLFNDALIHDVDMVCWIVGEKPESVFALGSSTTEYFRDLMYPDTIVVTLKFPGGVIGCIEVSWHSATGYDQRVEVLGSQCQLQVQNQHPITVLKTSTDAITRPPVYRHFDTRYEQAYKKEMAHFVDILEGKTDCHVKLDSLIDVSFTLEAIQRSLHLGQSVTL